MERRYVDRPALEPERPYRGGKKDLVLDDAKKQKEVLEQMISIPQAAQLLSLQRRIYNVPGGSLNARHSGGSRTSSRK